MLGVRLPFPYKLMVVVATTIILLNYRVAQKKLTCLIKHNAETKEFITPKTCSSLSLMSNLKFDMPYMLFHAIFAEISKFQFQYAFCKNGLKCLN